MSVKPNEGPPFRIHLTDGDGMVVDTLWTDASLEEIMLALGGNVNLYDSQEECEQAQVPE
jgi:hypothetical protein